MTQQPFLQAAALLPPLVRRQVEKLAGQDRVEELRLRVGRPITAVAGGEERPVPGTEPVTGEDLRTVLEIATQASVHTALERVRQGFVTVRGGHRVGLCGTAAVEEGRVTSLRFLSSLNIRVARAVPGAAAGVLPELLEGGRPAGTLILAPPGAGKTTLLRDLVKSLSDGDAAPPLRVGVADERGELAAMWEGRPELDLGACTDVMDGCPKALGMEMLLRGMNPQVLAVDEITAPADVSAALQAAGCGVPLLATAHGTAVKDLSLRPLYKKLLKAGVFEKAVLIRRGADGGRQVTVEELP